MLKICHNCWRFCRDQGGVIRCNYLLAYRCELYKKLDQIKRSKTFICEQCRIRIPVMATSEVQCGHFYAIIFIDDVAKIPSGHIDYF